MRALDGATPVKNSVNAGNFNLPFGGRYAIEIIASGSGTVELQRLGPDGTTFISIKEHFNNTSTAVELTVGSFASQGMFVLDLPPGVYKFVITTFTAVYARISRIPGE